LTALQEEEAEKLMAEALPKNFIDYEEYPQTADIQNKCVNMIARLYNAPTKPGEENAMGTRYVISRVTTHTLVLIPYLQHCWK
jgi:glutamate decarboxylase